MHGLGVSLECGREKLGNRGPSENWNSLSNCSPWAGMPLALAISADICLAFRLSKWEVRCWCSAASRVEPSCSFLNLLQGFPQDFSLEQSLSACKVVCA